MANDDSPDDDLPEHDTADNPVENGAAGRVGADPSLAIAAAVFIAATTRELRRRLASRKESLAVVIRVPTSAWTAPVGAFFLKKFGGKWTRVVRDGEKRSFSRDELQSDGVATELAKGRSIVGIAADLNLLPPTLLAAADAKIEIAVPNTKVLSDAVAFCCGGSREADYSSISVRGFDFPDLLSAFRKGSTPDGIRSRLAAMSTRTGAASGTDKLPDLRTATEYGQAREWALSLERDLADYRAGRLPWSALDRGVVVFSDPGIGKSMWARMVASLCSLPLIESSVADWFVSAGSGYLNDVIRNERQVFQRAGAMAPCILFLDEIDAVPNRATMSDRNRDYWTPILADILTNLDNAVAGRREGVIVIGATNHIKNLDPALLRPGRLERSIEIKRPDVAGVVNILRHHVEGLLPDHELRAVAPLMEGATGAEIMQLVRDARRAARQAVRPFSSDDLRNAALPEAKLEPEILWRICVHEAGHAIGSVSLSCGVVKKCVVRDDADGHGVTQFETAEVELPSRQQIEDRAIVSLCGRAAEEVLIGSVCANAGGDHHSDLATATRLVCSLYSSLGLMGSLVHLGAENMDQLLRLDAALRKKVDEHLGGLYNKAIALMHNHRTAIVAVASHLKERRHLSGDEIQNLFHKVSINAGDVRKPL